MGGGWTVEVLEKHDGFDVRGSTLGLAVNGSKALQEILPNHDVKTLTDTGILIEDTGGSMLAWWIVRDWLLEKVRTDANISLKMGMTLVSINDELDSSTAQVHCKEGEFYADLVIGADGVRSQVRTLLGCEANPETGYYVWRGSASARDDLILEPLLTMGLVPFGVQLWGTTTASIFNHHPNLDHRLNWVVMANDPCIEPGVTTPLDLAKPYLDDKMRPIFTRLFEKSTPHELVNSYAMATTVLPLDTDSGWGGQGRVTLIGDAAHAIRPASGQGTSMAFEDVAVLCRKLRNVDSTSMNPDDMVGLLRCFENERLKRVKLISDHERQVAEASHTGETYTNPMGNDEYKQWVLSGV